MTKLELQQLVAFCILMQGNDGILGKAPSYLAEKYYMCTKIDTEPIIRQLLDSNNQSIYDEYMEMWRIG